MTLPIFRRYGVTIGLYPADQGYDFEIERAADQGGLPHPDPAEREILGPIAGSRETYTDIQPPDGALRHYRIRHVKEGEEPSPWTCWVSGRPVEVPLIVGGRADPVPPVIREAIPSGGGQWQVELTVDDQQCRVTEVAFDVGTGYEPAAPTGAVYASPAVDLTTRIRARVTGYDAAGRLVVLMERDYGEGGGMPGPPGPYTATIYRAGASKPARPTGSEPAGWSDDPPTPGPGERVWASTVRRGGSRNLIPPSDAPGERREFTTATAVILSPRPITALGLAVGSAVSLSATLEGAGAGHAGVRLLIQWLDDASTVIRSDRSSQVTGATPELRSIDGVLVPSGATRVRAYYERTSGSPTGTAYGSLAMLNEGGSALPYEDPRGPLLGEWSDPTPWSGEAGEPAEAEFSGPDPGQNIAPTFDPQVHVYARWRYAGGDWSDWARIVGEEGAPGTDGTYMDYRFRASATQPTSPAAVPNPSGWVGTPPTVPAGQYLWMIAARKDSRTHELLPGETWSSPPVRMTQPGQLLPFAGVEVVSGAPAGLVRLRITGTDWEGGTSGLEYQYGYHWTDTPFPGWTAFAALPSGGATIDVDHYPGRDSRFGARVRDAEGRISLDTWYYIPASRPGIDRGTGKVDRTVPTSDGGTIETVAGAQEKASAAREGAVDDAVEEMEDRGLQDDGYDGLIGRGPSGRPADVVIQQVESPSANLLPSSSTPGTEHSSGQTGGGPAWFRIDLAEAALDEGDLLSVNVDMRRTGTGSLFLQLRWHAADGSLVRQDSSGNVGSEEYVHVTLAGRVVPAGAAYVIMRYNAAATATQVYMRRAMANRGPLALPYDEPPGRPGREGIDVWRGHLRPSVKRHDGARLLTIAAGFRVYEAWNGDPVTFDPPYQDTPIVVVIGPMTYSAQIAAETGGASQYRRWSADQVTAAGIGAVRMQLESVDNPDPKSASFPTGTLTAQGHTSAVALTSAATNGEYTAAYNVALSCTAAAGGETTLDVVLSVDTRKSGGGWDERGTQQYSLMSADGTPDQLTLSSEAITIVDSALGAGDDVRIRIKSIDVQHMRGTGSVNVEVAPVRLDWTVFFAERDPKDAIPPNPGERPGQVIVLGSV